MCGFEAQPRKARSLARQDLFCEMLTWQWEELGDGDQSEFAGNGCPMIAANQALNGDKRKGAGGNEEDDQEDDDHGGNEENDHDGGNEEDEQEEV